VRIGVLLPTRAAVLASARRPPVEECWAFARHADEAGYDAIWVGDSVVMKPRLEVMTTLAYLAAITSRVRLGTAVLLPALRGAVVLAQQIANVDQLARGRLVLGVGVGNRIPAAVAEWEACGMEHRARAACLEEQIAIWRALWSGEPVTYAGHGFRLVGQTLGPLPWRPEGVPILITAGNQGNVLPAALDRFARLGDGLIGTAAYADEYRVLRARAEEALAARGRVLPGFPICAYTSVRIESDVAVAERIHAAFLRAYYGGVGHGQHARGTNGLGPPEAVVEALAQYETAGVTDLCVRFSGDDQLGQLARFTEGVLPAFR
jgi:alkanesulfonate monooxygenase SsuD/methylene tetrahydromethanopterin reductase-like flavin-dependent oxidoreductase (luciferase family)